MKTLISKTLKTMHKLRNNTYYGDPEEQIKIINSEMDLVIENLKLLQIELDSKDKMIKELMGGIE